MVSAGRSAGCVSIAEMFHGLIFRGSGYHQTYERVRFPPDATHSSWWKIEPNVGRVVNELPFRVDRIKALGNAVVPSQVSEAFERLAGF